MGVFSAHLKNKTKASVESESNTETDPETAEPETSNKPAPKKRPSVSRGGWLGVPKLR